MRKYSEENVLNQNRRQQLTRVIGLLHNAETDLDSIKDEEQGCIDAMPENLQNSDRCASMENAVDCLEDAIESVQQAADFINDAINCG